MAFTKNCFYPLVILIPLIGGCSLIKRSNVFFPPKSEPVEVSVTKKKTIFISCGNGNVQEYLDKGWEIADTSSKDVACSWKEARSNPKCNLDKDKGCRITVPDKMGKQIKYLLEKKASK